MKRSSLSLFICLFALCYAAPSFAQEDPMSHLLRMKSYTPLPTNQSDIVPGMLLIVNWEAGTMSFEDLQPDAANLKFMPASTQALNATDHVTTTRVDATAALKSLIGFDIGVGFQADASYTFGGISFNVQRLNTNDIRALVTNKDGATYKDAEAHFLNGHIDVFVVAQVESAKTATITSTKSHSFVASASGSPTLKTCTVSLPAGTGTVTSGTATTPAEQQQKQATDKAASQTAAATTAAAATGTGGGATTTSATVNNGFDVCVGEGNRVTISNALAVPVALVTMRLIYTDEGKIILADGNFPVPYNNPTACKRSIESHDGCYNPPRR